ncbi:hypothetical protein GmHk_12G035656 [Glycine max]|nr:hypothetical protein GmHk_12G035656 [Glycine max]
MRNVSNTRFLTCSFRPVVDINATLKSRSVVDRSGNRRFACIVHVSTDKHDTKNNSATKATFLGQELAHNWVVPAFSKNTRARNSKNCFGSKGGYSVYAESSSSTGDEKQPFVVTNVQETKAPERSSLVSSSNSIVSESKNPSKCESTKDQVEKQKKFPCVRIYCVVVSLAVMIFLGKINVIVLTPLLLWNASCCCWPKEVPKLRNGRSGRNKEHDMLEPRAVVDHSANRRFTCIPVADKHDTKDSVTKTTFSEQEFAQNWVVVPHPQKRKFSKNTRARNKNLDGQSCFGSKGGYSASTESSSTGDEKKQAFAGTNIPKIKPPEWSSRISSSNSPESKSESPKDQVEKQKKFQCVGIYWVLLSLVVTVFWGKLRNAESKAHKNSRRDRSGRSCREIKERS